MSYDIRYTSLFLAFSCFAEGIKKGAMINIRCTSLFLAFSCFAEGIKKGAMITMREAFSGKYPFHRKNHNPNFYQSPKKKKNTKLRS